MDSLMIYFLPTIILLGIITSYEDIKDGKIRNKYIIAATLIALAIQAMLFYAGIIDLRYVGLAWTYAFFTAIIGFFIWQLGWWSPADAKLLFAFVLLTPPTAYLLTTTPFPPVDLLINSIIPIFIYSLAELIIRTTKQQKLMALKDTISPTRLLRSALAVFGLAWIGTILLNLAGVQNNYLLSLLIISILFSVIEKLARKYALHVLVAIGVTRAVFDAGNIISLNFLTRFMTTFILFILTFGFLRMLSKNSAYKVNINGLIPGMLLSQGITRNGLTKDIGLNKKDMLFYKTTPLGGRDIALIRGLHAKGRLHFNMIGVHHTTRLAPFLFLGTVLTILLQGNMIVFLRILLGF
jgi:Flp pilus assembly protein protease CpaA